MVDNTAVAVTAIAALAATVVVDRVMRVKERRNDVASAVNAARADAWYQGRESIMQDFGRKVEPQDFTSR